MIKKVILFLFVFLNYYNPISVYFTLIINILLILFISFYDGRMMIRLNRVIVVFTVIILIWAMLIMLIQSNINTYVLGKYLRVTASTLLIMVICSEFRISIKELINILSMVFLIHILSIGMQSIFPQLDLPMATFFQFERESTVISETSIRKLGCSSSYDTASLISISSMVFFYFQYVFKQKNKYLLLVLLSLLSCTRISRTGMVLGIFIFVVLFIVLFFISKGKKRLMPFFVLLSGLILTIYIILPIIASSTVSFLTETKYNNTVISNNDYSTGSINTLSSSYQKALKAPIWDLIIGFGIDPNRIPGKGTDMGYVKLIYHVGIIGLILVMLVYFYIFRKTIIIRKKSDKTSEEFILSSFLALYILLLLVMNYKSLEMYSRGSHDLLLIIFCVLNNRYETNKANNT